MAKFTVSDEGIVAIKWLAASIFATNETIKKDCAVMCQITEENSSGTGPHAKSIFQVVKEIAETAKSADDPIGDICTALDDLAEVYQDVLDNDIYAGSGNNGTSPATRTKVLTRSR